MSLKCKSIRNNIDNHLPCLMYAKPDHDYCSLHLLQTHIKDYQINDFEIDTISHNDSPVNAATINPVIKTIEISDTNNLLQNRKSNITTNKMQKNNIIHEQRSTTVMYNHKENEQDLEIRLLILANDNEYSDIIPKLIGPVFNDVTLSEDECDPVTMDPIWVLNDGKRCAANVNKYYLFSYIDSKNKVRCVTIFTLYDMVTSNNFTHQITMESMPVKYINRAKKLVDIYSTKLALFKMYDESTSSPEFKLMNKLTNLFKKFHTDSIYFDEKWLLDITDCKLLTKIINETSKLVSQNLKTLEFSKLALFKNPALINNNIHPEILLHYKQYIVEEWQRMIDATDATNKLPIWILALGLSFAVPEIKQKFPSLELMLV